MKKVFLLISILIIAVFYTIGCQKDVPAPGSVGPSKPVAETPNAMRPSIMVDGELYFSTGKEMPIEPDESWISFPHFYKKESIIVQYVGETEKIISDLKDIFGEQFAGYTP